MANFSATHGSGRHHRLDTKGSFHLCAEDKCAQSSLCTNITDAIWQKLLNDLTSYGQSSADTTRSSSMVDAVNTTFYILQPGVRFCSCCMRLTLMLRSL